MRTASERLDALLDVLGDVERLLILPHNDPDPDAIASALALRHLLAAALGLTADIVYAGIIGRAENKALVRYLGRPLRRLTSSDLRRSLPIALVDTQPGAGNNVLPLQADLAAVLDHHSWREATAAAGFVDVRPELGATSTILTEYLQAADIEPEARLATALFYGIKTDTMGLGRGASPEDVAAYFYLQPRIDIEALVEIERAQVPLEYFQRLDAALHAARVYDGVVISYIKAMTRPDMAAEMADLLLRLEGAQWAICIGAYEDEVILALRTRDRRGGAGRLAQEIVGDRGAAGGHGSMAAGHVPLNGQEAESLARQLGRLALERLHVSPKAEGKPILIEPV